MVSIEYPFNWDRHAKTDTLSTCQENPRLLSNNGSFLFSQNQATGAYTELIKWSQRSETPTRPTSIQHGTPSSVYMSQMISCCMHFPISPHNRRVHTHLTMLHLIIQLIFLKKLANIWRTLKTFRGTEYPDWNFSRFFPGAYKQPPGLCHQAFRTSFQLIFRRHRINRFRVTDSKGC